jgi:hypothetical protein
VIAGRQFRWTRLILPATEGPWSTCPGRRFGPAIHALQKRCSDGLRATRSGVDLAWVVRYGLFLGRPLGDR